MAKIISKIKTEFPIEEKCGDCRSVISIDYNDLFHGKYFVYDGYLSGIVWRCPVCGENNHVSKQLGYETRSGVFQNRPMSFLEKIKVLFS